MQHVLERFDNPTGKYTQVAEIVKKGSLCCIVSVKSLSHGELTILRAQNVKILRAPVYM